MILGSSVSSWLVGGVLGLTSIGGVASAPSAIELRDPMNILGLSDQFLGEQQFEKALQCGDAAAQEFSNCTVNCTESGCQTTCQPPALLHGQVIECSRDQAIMELKEDSKEPSLVTIKREEFEAARGNWLRAMVMSQLNGSDPSEMGYVSMDGASMGQAEIAGWGTVETMKVLYSVHLFSQGTEFNVSIMVELGKGLPFIAQAVSMWMPPADVPVSKIVWVKKR